MDRQSKKQFCLLTIHPCPATHLHTQLQGAPVIKNNVVYEVELRGSFGWQSHAGSEQGLTLGKAGKLPGQRKAL